MKRICLVFIVSILYGCGGSGSKGGSEDLIELEGDWQSFENPCRYLGKEVQGVHYDYIVQETQFREGYIIIDKVKNYNDANCTEPDGYNLLSESTYVIGDQILTESGVAAYEIDIQTVNTYRVEVRTGVETLIDERSFRIAQIVSVLSGILYWGLPSNIELRPTELNYEFPQYRVD